MILYLDNNMVYILKVIIFLPIVKFEYCYGAIATSKCQINKGTTPN